MARRKDNREGEEVGLGLGADRSMYSKRRRWKDGREVRRVERRRMEGVEYRKLRVKVLR